MANPWDNDPIIEPRSPWQNDPQFDPAGMAFDPGGRPVAMRPPRVEDGYSEPTPPQRGNWFQENVIGRGEIDSPGERVGAIIGDIIRSGGSGVIRGATGLADMPGRLAAGGADLAERGVQSMFGETPPQWTGQIAEGLAMNPFAPAGPGTMERGVRTMPGGDGAMDYAPQTTAGEYSQTAGEFLPGAALFGGLSPANLAQFGVVPGLASEAAGQMTEGMTVPDGVPVVGGMDAEPFARAAGAIAGPSVFNAAARTVTPNPADPSRVAAARRLEREGVNVTAGQRTGSVPLRVREEGANRTAQILDDQGDEFTSAILRQLGWSADDAAAVRNVNPEVAPTRAQPEVLDRILTRIGNTFDDLGRRHSIDGQSVRPLSQASDDALRLFNDNTARSTVPPSLQTAIDRVRSAAQQGHPLSGSQYTRLRSQLSGLTRNSDAGVRDAAVEMIGALDDALAQSMRSAGAIDDLASFAQARQNYRDFLVVERAASATGEAAASGIISPAQISMAARQIYGRRGFTQGRSELGNLGRAGQAVMTGRPNSGTPERLNAGRMFEAAGTTGTPAGLATYAMTGDPAISAGTGIAAAALPSLRNAMSTSRAGQAYLGNQLFPQQSSVADPRNLAILASLLGR